MSDTALRMADELDGLGSQYDSEIAAELRRLHAENEALKVELHEQARVNGMGGERETSLMAELERKSDAIQRLWKERDELRTLNAELVKALKHAAECVQTNYLPDKCGHDWDDVIAKAEASNG